MFDFISHMSIASIILVFVLMPTFYVCVGALFTATSASSILDKALDEDKEVILKSRMTYTERKKYDERV